MAKKTNVVNKSKGTMNLLVILIVAVGWLTVVMALTNDEEAKAQEALAQSAEKYMEDKLYIRAVNAYEEALKTYQTERNSEYEERLLAILKEAGMEDKYHARIKDRISKKTATAEEYIELANVEIEEEDYVNAISILKSGLDVCENDEMVSLYESICYFYDIHELNHTTPVTALENWPIPVYNGEKWGYMSKNGKLLLDFQYEEATRFYKGYAIVKINGVYTRIEEDGYWFAVDKLGLDQVVEIGANSIVAIENGKYGIYTRSFQPMTDETFDCIYLNDNGVYMVQKDGKWALLSSDFELITDYIFTDVKVNSRGQIFSHDFAVVKDEGGYFVITPDGKARTEERFADAKAYEDGWFAVANEEGKWGFSKTTADMMIDYQYDDAMSFSSKVAAVKVGDSWGYINRYNTMVIEASYEEAYPFAKQYALIKYPQGNYYMLELRYYDLIK